MQVIGAGMAGLLSAAMLRGKCSRVIEAQPSLPNNHSALLRFRSSIVGDTLNIPFKQVQAMKIVLPWQNSIADAMAYSHKTNGHHSFRSLLSVDRALVTRYIAPENLINQMEQAVMAPIEFGKKIIDFHRDIGSNSPIISTLPMPVLMQLLVWPHEQPEFRSVSGFNINVSIKNTDAYVSMYIPDPEEESARISLTGSKLVIEYPKPGVNSDQLMHIVKHLGASQIVGMVRRALSLIGCIKAPLLGDPEVKVQNYAKILPIDENIRRQFIMWATEKFNVYSVGRFATWRPGLLLDDVVNDVRVVQKIAHCEAGSYDYKK